LLLKNLKNMENNSQTIIGDVIHTSVFKLCSHCQQEYKVEFGENLVEFIAVMQTCPHCKKTDHILMRIPKSQK